MEEKSFAAAVNQNGMTLHNKVTGALISVFPTANKEETKRSLSNVSIRDLGDAYESSWTHQEPSEAGPYFNLLPQLSLNIINFSSAFEVFVS